jgi:hypothetical protein
LGNFRIMGRFMADIPVPQKPIPQYTIRWMLGLMTGWAVVFSIVALAIRGHTWALCVSVGIGGVALFMIVGGALFSVVWFLSRIFSRRSYDSADEPSPLASYARVRPSEPFSNGDGME